jgi:hypothetical protein
LQASGPLPGEDAPFPFLVLLFDIHPRLLFSGFHRFQISCKKLGKGYDLFNKLDACLRSCASGRQEPVFPVTMRPKEEEA